MVFCIELQIDSGFRKCNLFIDLRMSKIEAKCRSGLTVRLEFFTGDEVPIRTRAGGGEISPGGTLRGRQNHVLSSTGRYGIGLNIVKLTLFVKKFACGAIFDFFISLFYSYCKKVLPAAHFFFEL